MAPSFMQVTTSLLNASLYTLGIFFITLACAIPLGAFVCACGRSKFKPLSFLTKIFIWIIRGTPLMLQIIVIFYFSSFPRFVAACVAFSINYAAYFAEIYRGGLESIPVGQYEACKVLGMTKLQTNFKIVFPQVVKRITAPMGNEIITLVKDTSLANIIAISEIILTAKEFIKSGSLWPLLYTAVFYLTFTAIITLLLRYAEKKMSYYR